VGKKKSKKKRKNLPAKKTCKTLSFCSQKSLRAQAISLVDDITTAEKKERNNKHAIRNVEF